MATPVQVAKPIPKPKYLVRMQDDGTPVFSEGIGEAARWSVMAIACGPAAYIGGRIEQYLGDWVVCVDPPKEQD